MLFKSSAVFFITWRSGVRGGEIVRERE